MPTKLRDILHRLLDDERGVATVEYTLLLAFFGVPMVLLCRLMLEVLIAQYQLVVFYETLPFP